MKTCPTCQQLVPEDHQSDQEVYDLWNSGHSIMSIARATGASWGKVNAMLQRAISAKRRRDAQTMKEGHNASEA